MSKSFKPEVMTDSTGKWYSNALRFATEAEAISSAHDLAMRWMLVRDYRAAPSDDPPNYTWIDGIGLQRIPTIDPPKGG